MQESRRQKKVASVVKAALSDIILHHMNDPRIEGIVSVTRVEMTPDLRKADVYISVFGVEPNKQKHTFTAIVQAKRHIQSLLAGQLHSKSCPSLNFVWDEKFKKTLEIFELIDQASAQLPEETPDSDQQDTEEPQ